MMVRGTKQRLLLLGVGMAVWGLLLAASAFGQGGSEPPPASYELDPVVVDQYAQQYGVDPSEAERRLRVQQRGADIVAALDEAVGDSYGGAWFDNATGRFGVGLLNGGRADEAQRVLRDRGIEDQADLVDVATTAAELEDAAREVATRIEDLIEAGKAQPGVDQARNALVVAVSDEASPGDRARIEEAGRAEDVSTVLEDARDEQFRSVPTACGPFNHCDRPLRGGVNIARSGAGCTAGYMAYNPASPSNHYLLTAGHCGATATQWTAFRPSQSAWETIGDMYGRIYGAWGDYGTIRANLQWAGTAFPWVVVWNANQTVNNDTYGLIDTALSFVGQFGCKVGSTLPLSCGTVLRTGVTVSYPGTNVGGLAETNACSLNGDSGGPWVSVNYAYGITSGGNAPNNGAGPCTGNQNIDRHFFSEVRNAEALLGVRVVTNVSGPV